VTDDKLQWWGYIHTNGSFHVKRYFDPYDLREAQESSFCAEVYGPFDADSHDEALRKLHTKAGR